MQAQKYLEGRCYCVRLLDPWGAGAGVGLRGGVERKGPYTDGPARAGPGRGPPARAAPSPDPQGPVVSPYTLTLPPCRPVPSGPDGAFHPHLGPLGNGGWGTPITPLILCAVCQRIPLYLLSSQNSNSGCVSLEYVLDLPSFILPGNLLSPEFFFTPSLN